MRYIVLLLSFLSLACGQQQRSDITQASPMFSGVDPVLQVYLDRFTADTGVSTSGITAGFTDLGGNLDGECVMDGQGHREIRIDQSDYNQMSGNDALVEQLVYHELGHCALYLQHINVCDTDGLMTDPADASKTQCDGQPMSVMNWESFSGAQIQVYQANREAYIKALVDDASVELVGSRQKGH
jgi:hypothetical protein